MQSTSEPISHFAAVRSAATRARSGTLEDAHAYVASIILSGIRESTLSRILQTSVTRLQILYIQGEVGGIREDQLVTALNKVADEAGLPDYGKTSQLEFRLLRLTLLGHVPELTEGKWQLPGPATDLIESALSTVLPAMSPAEALYLTCSLARQKRFNPQFQLNESELKARYAGLRVEAPKSSPVQYTLQSLPVSDRATAIQGKLEAYGRRFSSARSASTVVESFLMKLGYDASRL